MYVHTDRIFFYISVSLVLSVRGFQLDGPALPNRPWISVWNVPTDHCDKFGIHINLSHFDIVQNPNDNFTGEFMTIFYKLGLFPRLDDDGTIINGGIPQLGNLTRHLLEAKNDIQTTIPDFDFQGLGVIDFESYRPIWEENWDKFSIYRDMSRDLVKKRHPDWSKDQIEKQAKMEFEQAIKEFMMQTLAQAKNLRPKGHWGYYHYPYCFNYKDVKIHCETRWQKYNDEESWLFSTSQALYPSIYLHGNHPQSQRWKLLHAIIEEAFRQSHRTAGLPVFVYTKFQYNDRTPYWFYTKEDLINSLKMAADFGSSGSIIWGSFGDFRHEQGCKLLQAFMDQVMGPIVRNLTQFTTSCSQNRCSKNGRCVWKGYAEISNSVPVAYRQPFIRHSPVSDKFDIEGEHPNSIFNSHHQDPYDQYVCRCYKGWKGDRCQSHNSL